MVILQSGHSGSLLLNAENTEDAIKQVNNKGYRLIEVTTTSRRKDMDGNEITMDIKPLIDVSGVNFSLFERLFPLTNFRNYCGAGK